MHPNGSTPTYTRDDLSLVTIPFPIYVAGYQAQTSNSLELHAPAGESPIARVIHQFMDAPPNVAQLPLHPALQMASAYTDFINLDTPDPLFRYTMGMRVDGTNDIPGELDVVEVPAGEFLKLEVPGPFHTTVPAAWSWMISQFDDGEFPWRRTYTGELELYEPGEDSAQSVCSIYVSVSQAD